MKLNFNKARENSGGDFSVIPENRYDLVIDSAKSTESRVKKTPMLELKMTILGPSFENRKVWKSFALTPPAMIYLINFLKACGLEELAERDEVEVGDIINEVPGSKVGGFISITTNPNSGKERNEVENFTEYTGSTEGAAPATATNTGKKKLFNN
jgi:hypothetical protein